MKEFDEMFKGTVVYEYARDFLIKALKELEEEIRKEYPKDWVRINKIGDWI